VGQAVGAGQGEPLGQGGQQLAELDGPRQRPQLAAIAGSMSPGVGLRGCCHGLGLSLTVPSTRATLVACLARRPPVVAPRWCSAEVTTMADHNVGQAEERIWLGY
jgi:hypothetical protein